MRSGELTGSRSEKLRVLFVAHGHPRFTKGGAEQHAYELYRAFSKSGGFEAYLLARTGEERHRPPPGTVFRTLEEDPHQILLYTQGMDYFFHSQRDKTLFTRHLRELLAACQPDVVHFQHTLHIGIDFLRLVAGTLPGVPILVTLHEYLYICHAHGQMVRTDDGKLCERGSPQRCHECFPGIAPSEFFLRERFIKSHLELVDRFICPSRFLLERYAEWGLPRDRLMILDYGRPSRPPLPPRPLGPGERRNRFGYFGQLNPYKGILELLEAVRRLSVSGARQCLLYLNGANLHLQAADFQARYRDLLRQCAGLVTDLGPYDEAELADRMRLVDWVVVPSIWWENSPLVIQEAFLHGRPVICSDVGGMKEKVTDGVNGLHFRRGDVDDLARVIARASDSAGLWERLRENIRPLLSIEECVAAYARIYCSLRESKQRARAHA